MIAWARSLDEERLWALEDCRHVTRGLEQLLLSAGERVVRVPPRLTAPQRRRGRTRGKSDALDALAVARAALQEPELDGPRTGEQTLRELKLLVDHRDDLVAERRRCQQRLRWHLHELDPALMVPLGALDRAVWIDRLGRQLARREQTKGSPATCLAAAARSPARSPSSTANSRRARRRSRRGCCSCPAAGRSARPSCSARSARSIASAATPSSPATPASHRSTPAPANTNATASTAAATANSTAPCTGSRSPKAACTHPHAPTSSAKRTKARAAAKPSAASNDNSPAPSTPHSKRSQH